MASVKILLKIALLSMAFLFSFVLPAVVVPRIEGHLSSFSLNLVQNLLAATPTFLVLVLVVAYHNIDLVYILTNRAWMWVTNSPVSWSMTAEFTDVASREIDAIFGELVNSYDDAEVILNRTHEKVVNLPRSIGGVVSLRQRVSEDSDELPDDQDSLLVRIFDLNVPFRTSEKSLLSLDYLLSNVVERNVHPQIAKYTFRANFPEDNPYYGLYLRKEKVLSKDVVSFVTTSVTTPVTTSATGSARPPDVVAHPAQTATNAASRSNVCTRRE